jgi:ubiquinone/menaquinone biosynthesis C-methylase UbiE
MEMDGQLSTHGESYAYTSPYWAECYDMWVEDIVGPTALAKDDDFFFSLLSPFLPNISSKQEPLRVVDMATGTGRVIRGLLRNLESHAQKKTPLENQDRIEIWGIDHSQAMIEGAKSLLENKLQPSTTVKWRNTTAANFVDENPQLHKAVDLIIFAAGSIGHLTAPGERKRFLQQVVKALRKTDHSRTNHSVAAISILKEEVSLNSTGQDIPDLQVSQASEMRKTSQRWPHLEYHKSPITTLRNEDRLVDSFKLSVIETATEKIISQETHSWSLKLFNEDEWERELAGCGLNIRDKIETKSKMASETWYLLYLTEEKDFVV